jgi:hypothetical protein
MRAHVALAAFAAILVASSTTHAQENPSYAKRIQAPRDALEISFGTGLVQGTGRIQGGARGAISDVAGTGVAFQTGVGYRFDPYRAIFLVGQYQEFATGEKPGVGAHMNDEAARSAAVGIDGEYHLLPYRAVDPWARLGVGYRVLWDVRASPAPNIAYSGLDLARITIGADLRATPVLAIGPFVGATITTFLWQDEASLTAIGQPRTSVFFSAGLQGRFDAFGWTQSSSAVAMK